MEAWTETPREIWAGKKKSWKYNKIPKDIVVKSSLKVHFHWIGRWVIVSYNVYLPICMRSAQISRLFLAPPGPFGSPLGRGTGTGSWLPDAWYPFSSATYENWTVSPSGEIQLTSPSLLPPLIPFSLRTEPSSSVNLNIQIKLRHLWLCKKLKVNADISSHYVQIFTYSKL